MRCAVLLALAWLLPVGVLAANVNSEGYQVDNRVSVDYPADARWEPCRTCHLTVTGFIEAVEKPSKYTDNEDATPNQPKDIAEFKMIKTYDEVVMPAMTRWYQKEFLVVRTDETFNASECLPDTPAYAQYRNKQFKDCDLVLVTKWKQNHHATGGRCGQNKYGRTTVAVMTMGPDNIGFEYKEMIPDNRFYGTDKEYWHSMAIGWHEFNHGMLGGVGIYKKWTLPWWNKNQGMGSTFLDNVIRKFPSYWPQPSFVQHFMKNLPAGSKDFMYPNPGGQGLFYMNTPRALEMTRYWTNCPTEKGYPLKNAKGGAAEYNFGHHANFAGNWGDVNCYGRHGMVSAMTLGMYEDTGLWKVNWTAVEFNNVNQEHTGPQNMTRMMTEHFKQGCGFFTEPWPYETDESHATVSPYNGKTYYDPKPGWSQMLCNRASYGGTLKATKRHYCNADRKGKAVCARRNDVDEFTEGGWGWAEGGDWEDILNNAFRGTRVMVAPSRLDGEKDVAGVSGVTIGTCRDSGSQNAALYGESASEDSRCFRGTLEPDGQTPWKNSFESAFCFEHRCTAKNLIEFKVGNSKWYTCPELGGTVNVDGFTGHVTCPHQMLMCPANCPNDCNGRGVCNRVTGICMCTETLVKDSYVGIGCETKWTQYWPSEYPYDGQFKTIEIELQDLPHWNGPDELALRAAVRSALGLAAKDEVLIDVATLRFEVRSEHFLPGVTQAAFDKVIKPPYGLENLRYEVYNGMVAGKLNKDSSFSSALTYKDVVVSKTRESTGSSRRHLFEESGLYVPFTVYPDGVLEAASAKEIKSRCAQASTFSSFKDKFGAEPVVSKAPEMFGVAVVSIGAKDAGLIAKINTALAGRTTFDAKVLELAKEGGMYSTLPGDHVSGFSRRQAHLGLAAIFPALIAFGP